MKKISVYCNLPGQITVVTAVRIKGDYNIPKININMTKKLKDMRVFCLQIN